MKRFYSPDSYCASGACVNDLLSQRIKSSHNIHSTISLTNYHSQQTKKIGRYYYSENDQIGRGYTSKVYKAYTLNSSNTLCTESEPFAIKVISLAKSTPSSMQLLQNQIEILKMLDHPNIIKCYDIYKSKTHCYIITEYCPGGCLMSFINKNQPANGRKALNQDKVISIVQQIVQGVKYLQLRGIIHRDIKPANILKGKGTWKIADFGFAIQSRIQVKSKFNVGTPLYMPIQSLNQNLYSPQSDIFSIGIILYEMLTGTTPWESKSEKQLIRKLQLIPLQRSSGKNIISSPVFTLIMKLCSLKKKYRMSKQQFIDLQISQAIRFQPIQNPQASISDLKQELSSIKSDSIFQRKLRQNKSMDHIQFLKEKEKQNLDKMDRNPNVGSMILEKYDQSQLLGLGSQKNLSLLIPEKSKQITDAKQLKSYGSKKQIFWSIKDRYFDVPLTIKSTNLKKNYPIHTPNFLQKGTLRLQVKPTQKQEDYTRSTEAKRSQISITPSVSQKINPQIESKYIDEMTHIYLNQVHFCRFLFYLYKNSLYILLCKKSQQRLAVLIFKLIFESLDELMKIHNYNLDQRADSLFANEQKLSAYLKSEKCQMMKKTIKQYKQKYQKEYSGLKIKLGRKVFQQMQIEQKLQQELLSKSSRTKSNECYRLLRYAQKQTKTFLKQYDHNLILTMDSMTSMNYLSSPRYNKQNGFISANMQGLKNLYQLHRLVGILIQSDRNLQVFQKKSKIKVNTDYAKNNEVTSSQLQKIRELIRLL